MLARYALGQTADESSFWGYWDSIKNRIVEIVNMGSGIKLLMAKAADLEKRSIRLNLPDTANITQARSITTNLYTLWLEVKGNIEKYLPDWSTAAEEHPITTTYSGVGLIPLLVIGTAGLAALAYTATAGLSLIKDYYAQKSILAQLEAKVITAEEAKGLLSVGSQEGFFSRFGTQFGKGISPYVGLGIAGLAFIYLYPILKTKR